MKEPAHLAFPAARAIAERFVEARLAARSLAEFPGPLPPDLPAAYECQELAIGLWPDQIAGWKVGLARTPEGSAGRLVGPIFRQSLREARATAETEFPVFEHGFAAVEAEIVVRLKAGVPGSKTAWRPDEAAEWVATMHVGIETAGSPLAAINDLGACAIVADFGNNAGLIVGPEIPDWASGTPDSLTAETILDGEAAGTGRAGNLPGGPLAALAFALEACAARGRPLEGGQLVSTGAITGVHRVRPGQRARVVFEGIGELLACAVPASPTTLRPRRPEPC